MSAVGAKKLLLSFHDRIIDSLGIQIHQSPIAAVVELIANAWDTNGARVDVTSPANYSLPAKV